jgi:hypothetical protein
MKKALEVKMVMFAIDDNNPIKMTPKDKKLSPASFSRTDTSPS